LIEWMLFLVPRGIILNTSSYPLFRHLFFFSTTYSPTLPNLLSINYPSAPLSFLSSSPLTTPHPLFPTHYSPPTTPLRTTSLPISPTTPLYPTPPYPTPLTCTPQPTISLLATLVPTTSLLITLPPCTTPPTTSPSTALAPWLLCSLLVLFCPLLSHLLLSTCCFSLAFALTYATKLSFYSTIP